VEEYLEMLEREGLTHTVALLRDYSIAEPGSASFGI